MGKEDYKTIEDYFINEVDNTSVGHVIEKGKASIILTSPHSVSHIREGINKIGEYRTGLIVKQLGEMSNCHIAYKTRNMNDDANYDQESIFKKDLVRYIKTNNIKLLIDFHLSKPNRKFSIDIGTGKKANIENREDILNIFIKEFSKVYKAVKVDNTFTASFPYTVSATVSRELNIAAFQIEINWEIVDDYNKTEFFIINLLKILEKLEGLL
ncbi:hypothetical protein [Clostridium sp. DL1XJH146]